MPTTKSSIITKEAGPLPVWGWGVVAIASIFLYRAMIGGKSSTAKTTTDGGVNTYPIDTRPLIVFTGKDEQGPAPTFNITIPPTPGGSGGPIANSSVMAVPPIHNLNLGGRLIDPTTGRPIFSGPNGEGGYGGWSPGQPLPAGRQAYQMPDGTWATYVPGQQIQNGNRSALGLLPISNATSTAPNADSGVVSYLNQLSGAAA